MTTQIEPLNHPKFIWYYIRTEKTWYLPYFSGIPLRLHKNRWQFTINESEQIDIDLRRSNSILFYGANDRTGALPIAFLKECAANSVSIIIHQNHTPIPLIFYPDNKADRDDLLSQQIRHRDNKKQQAYIARTLIKWQWHAREWLSPTITPQSELTKQRSAEEVMKLEAAESKHYWSVYFRKLGCEGVSRRSEHPVNEALDALSHFLSGMTLRWILAHGLSPSHGFLHRSTLYSSLTYDLMELTRAWTEQAVFETYKISGSTDLVNLSTTRFKEMLEEPVHTEPTRQLVYRRTLINGGVIALRYYLSGKMKFFLPPVSQCAKSRGRKRNCEYSLPGHIWEK